MPKYKWRRKGKIAELVHKKFIPLFYKFLIYPYLSYVGPFMLVYEITTYNAIPT